MRRKGKCSPSKAARILGVHTNTIYNWCRAVEGGQPTRIKKVERHPVTGYLYLDLDEIRGIKGGGGIL